MVNVSAYPISVDGVRLDTLAWGVEASRLRVGAIRSSDQVLAGLDGLVHSPEDPREPSSLTLSMFVRGTDADGLVPGGSSSIATLRNNLDELLNLFGRTNSLLDVREVVDPGGTQRALASKVLDAIEPDLEVGTQARFVVSLLAPGCYWRDVATADYVSGTITSGTAMSVTTLTGSSAPVDDAAILVTGPIANPVVTSVATGASVRLNRSLSATEFWRIDNATWESRVGTTLGLGSAPTTGTDVSGLTETTGLYPRLLRLTPLRTSAADATRLVRVSLTGTGITTATRLSMRTRRAFL